MKILQPLLSKELQLLKLSRCRSYSLSSGNPLSLTPSSCTNTNSTPDIILSTRQLLRSSPSQTQLNETMLDLVKNHEITADSLSLMSQILKKLKTEPTDTTASGQEGSITDKEVITIIPGFTTQQSFEIFKCIINEITQENFQSAKFIPRFYLQLLSNFQILRNKESFLETVRYFLRYLFILNQEEGQLVVILRSLLNDTSHGLFEKSDIIRELLQSSQEIPDDLVVCPSLLVSVYDMVSGELPKSSHNKLVKEFIIKLENYLTTRNKIFTLNPQYAQDIQKFLNEAIISSSLTNFENLIKGLRLSSLEVNFEEQQYLILQKLSVNTKSLKRSDYLPEFVHHVFQSTLMSKDEKITVLEPFIKIHSNYQSETEFVTAICWGVLKTDKFNGSVKSIILNNENIASSKTLSSIISTFSATHPESFITTYKEIIDFFKTELNIDIENQTFEVLLAHGIRTSNCEFLKDIYNYGLSQGLDYSKVSPQLLNQFFCTIARDPTADIFEIFQWSKKIKRFVNVLNSTSYDSLMKLILKNEFIEDAIKSFTNELPELKDPNVKFQVSNYPELFHTMYDWILAQQNPSRAELVWFIYKELEVYFDIPYDCYFPIIKKFHQLKATELSFQLFQKMKKNHRLFGTPPPTPEMYAYLFNSFADEVYQDGIDTLYAILKIDLSINIDIQIMNSLLNAYTQLRALNKVSDIFYQIQTLPANSGINHQTISIMIKSQGLISGEAVDDFWNSIHRYGIQPNSDNLTQYLIAKSHNGTDNQEVLRLLKTSNEEYDIKATQASVDKLYNWFENDKDQQKLIADWAEDELKWSPRETSLVAYSSFSKDETVVAEMHGMGFTDNEVRFLEFGRVVNEKGAGKDSS